MISERLQKMSLLTVLNYMQVEETSGAQLVCQIQNLLGI